MLADAVDLALRDQEDAGIDIVSDGEMRRAGFFTAEFYRHLDRSASAALRTTAGRGRARPAAPVRGARADRRTAEGLGVVAEYRYAATRARRR